MNFEDIIIIGPSNTGKTYLGNYIASKTSLAVFNCDSVQVYKYLDSLTSKPDFIDQSLTDTEVISRTELQSEFDEAKFSNIEFIVYENFEDGLKRSVLQSGELKKYMDSLTKGFKQHKDRIDNYLFDIREPLENYSSFEFDSDIKRISSRLDLKQKVIVGGTIYYAYNYIFNLFDEARFLTKDEELVLQDEIEKMTPQEMISFLEERDPESLKFLKIDNLKRVQNAVKYIKESGQKYSTNYFKESNIRPNFVLIILKPKDRELYYKSLDLIIDGRVSKKTFQELEFITRKYDANVFEWLSKVSYEYKYFLQIYSEKTQNELEFIPNPDLESPKVSEELQTLKYKEHQYAKRQMTFIRRLEKKLTNHG